MEPIISGIISIIGKLIPDPDLRAKLQAQMMSDEIKLQLQQLISQTQIDTAEAASASLFIAGWRPLVGWVCALVFTFYFLIVPILAMFGLTSHIPPYDVSTLMTVMSGMLGIAGIRTFEKHQGIDTQKITIRGNNASQR